MADENVPKELRKSHPEIRAVINGKPDDHRVKWTHPLVAKAVADACLAQLKKDPNLHTFSLSPDDGANWDESDDTKYDAGDFDPAANAVSKTDRLMVFCNRVAKAVTGGGVATAALALGVDHGLGPVMLHRIEATVRPENAASRAVLAKVGFREEGLLRRYLEVDGAWRDHLLVAITVEELEGSATSRLVRAGRAAWS